jgi:hypothetical protein
MRPPARSVSDRPPAVLDAFDGATPTLSGDIGRGVGHRDRVLRKRMLTFLADARC